MLFVVYQRNRSTDLGIVRAILGVVVLVQSPLQVTGTTNIQGTVIALEYVGVEHED